MYIKIYIIVYKVIAICLYSKIDNCVETHDRLLLNAYVMLLNEDILSFVQASTYMSVLWN